MNCDQAFDLMTDPAHDDSAVLHAHLDACPRCRQMYETLSPALGLFATETATPSALDRDADYASSVTLAERVAVTLSQATAPSTPQRRWSRSLLKVSAAAVLAYGAVFGTAALLSQHAASTPTAMAECTWVNRDIGTTAESSDAVVLSCVACHLSRATD